MLVVEDGTGVIGANSLISLEYADEFLSMFGDCWCGCQSEKERYIRQANYLLCSRNFNGQAVKDNQLTPFPREHAFNSCDEHCGCPEYLETNEIPEKIKQAQALLAMGLCSGGITPFSNQNRGVVESFSMGDISVNFEDGKGIHVDDISGGNCNETAAKCNPMPQIKSLLSCYLKASGFGSKIRSVNARVTTSVRC